MSLLTPDEQITKDTYDKQAKQWAKEHSFAGYWADELSRFHKLLPKGKLLEIGAGGGRDAKLLTKFGYEYLGIDVSGGLIEQAQKKNPGTKFIEMSVYDLNFHDEFDGFWCSAVLLHIPRERIDEALKRMHRAMKKGAIGFISIKKGSGEVVEADDEHTGKNERLFIYWQNDDFKKVLKKNKFEIVEEGYKPMSEHTKWLTYMVKTQ